MSGAFKRCGTSLARLTLSSAGRHKRMECSLAVSARIQTWSAECKCYRAYGQVDCRGGRNVQHRNNHAFPMRRLSISCWPCNIALHYKAIMLLYGRRPSQNDLPQQNEGQQCPSHIIHRFILQIHLSISYFRPFNLPLTDSGKATKMSREQLIWAQAIFTTIAVFIWWAFDPNSWSNSVLSYIIDVSPKHTGWLSLVVSTRL